MNKVCLCGRLTKDPDVRYSQGENATCVARYSLAVDRKYSKGEEKQSDFINCVAFGKSGEFAEKYLKKGTKILVIGRIQTGSYEKDGKKVYTTDVVIEEHEFCEGKKGSGDGTEAPPAAGDDEFMQIGDQTTLPF